MELQHSVSLSEEERAWHDEVRVKQQRATQLRSAVDDVRMPLMAIVSPISVPDSATIGRSRSTCQHSSRYICAPHHHRTSCGDTVRSHRSTLLSTNFVAQTNAHLRQHYASQGAQSLHGAATTTTLIRIATLRSSMDWSCS